MREIEQIITISIRLEVMYLPSNGATASVIHHDPDLHFQRDEFLNVKISIYQRILQAAIDSHKIETDLHFGEWETLQVYVFFIQFCFLFHLFQVERKTHAVSFLKHNSNNSITDC